MLLVAYGPENLTPDKADGTVRTSKRWQAADTGGSVADMATLNADMAPSGADVAPAVCPSGAEAEPSGGAAVCREATFSPVPLLVRDMGCDDLADRADSARPSPGGSVANSDMTAPAAGSHGREVSCDDVAAPAAGSQGGEAACDDVGGSVGPSPVGLEGESDVAASRAVVPPPAPSHGLEAACDHVTDSAGMWDVGVVRSSGMAVLPDDVMKEALLSSASPTSEEEAAEDDSHGAPSHPAEATMRDGIVTPSHDWPAQCADQIGNANIDRKNKTQPRTSSPPDDRCPQVLGSTPRRGSAPQIPDGMPHGVNWARAWGFIAFSGLWTAVLWALSDLALRHVPVAACGSWVQSLGLASCNCQPGDIWQTNASLFEQPRHWAVEVYGFILMVGPRHQYSFSFLYGPAHLVVGLETCN